MQANQDCDHENRKTVWHEERNDWTGEIEGEWRTETTSLIKDIDLHRYQCTRCKQIGYYSGAAMAYYEQGKRTPGVQGLE
jgi:hypothetical protein